MAHWRLITVGRPKNRALIEVIEDYLKRTRPWHEIKWVIVPEVAFDNKNARNAQDKEARSLQNALGDQDLVILLDVKGEQVDSIQFSEYLAGWEGDGRSVSFIVGGSLGVTDTIRNRADVRLSLSALTLPHALAQVLMAEQLYRGMSILHNHPYHKY